MLRELIFELLAEGRKEELFAKYPDISVEDAWSTDPSPTKKYVTWMLKQMSSGESLDDVAPAIIHFHRHNSKYQSKDINSYKTLEDLENEAVRVEELGQTKTQKRKTNKAGAHLMNEDEAGSLYRIDTKEAAMQYGKGTRWCITMENSDYFNNYTNSGVIFYFYFSNFPKNENFSKLAFALQRSGKGISKIDIFDSSDTQISEVDAQYSAGVSDHQFDLMETDAISRPIPVKEKIRQGMKLSKDEVESFIKSNSYKTVIHTIIKYVDPSRYKDFVDGCPKSSEKIYFILTHYRPVKGSFGHNSGFYKLPEYKNDLNIADQIAENGLELWFDKDGRRHRDGGPAIKGEDYEEYFQHGVRHRTDGPAIVSDDGTQQFYINGVLHRDDGPAFITSNGEETWYTHGKKNRLDGPAFISFYEGTRNPYSTVWYKNGKVERDGGLSTRQKYSRDGKLQEEMWQDADGRKHRIGGPAVIIYDAATGEITDELFYEDGMFVNEVRHDVG